MTQAGHFLCCAAEVGLLCSFLQLKYNQKIAQLGQFAHSLKTKGIFLVQIIKKRESPCLSQNELFLK